MRNILPVLLMLFGNIAANAQAIFSRDDHGLFYGGLNLGANFSQIDGDSFSGYHKVGVAGGGVVYLRFLHLFAFSLGLGYAQKGTNEASLRETVAGPAVFRYRVHLQYAEIPVLLHLILPGKKIHYSAGFSYGRLMSSTEESEDINMIQINPELYPFEKRDWSGIVGLTYQISGPFFLSGQYQYSVSSIRNDPNIPPGYSTGSGKELNNVMSLKLMYLIGSGINR